MKDRVLRDFARTIRKIADTPCLEKRRELRGRGGYSKAPLKDIKARHAFTTLRRRGRVCRRRIVRGQDVITAAERAVRRKRKAGTAIRKNLERWVRTMNDEHIAIVDNAFEETELPFGQRWGGDFPTIRRTPAALRRQTIALDVMHEYVIFIALEKPEYGQ
jgi:hypothetical protein